MAGECFTTGRRRAYPTWLKSAMIKRDRIKKTVIFLVILSFLLPAVQLLGAGQEEGPAKELTEVTFRMNWKFTGPHAVYLLGKELGFYEEEGIDLQVMEGSGSVTTGQLIGNKSDDFGLADATALGNGSRSSTILITNSWARCGCEPPWPAPCVNDIWVSPSRS